MATLQHPKQKNVFKLVFKLKKYLDQKKSADQVFFWSEWPAERASSFWHGHFHADMASSIFFPPKQKGKVLVNDGRQGLPCGQPVCSTYHRCSVSPVQRLYGQCWKSYTLGSCCPSTVLICRGNYTWLTPRLQSSALAVKYLAYNAFAVICFSSQILGLQRVCSHLL